MGRPWPQPGEEFFTQEDTDYAIALAEEERDTCHACGMPKAWCRDPANKFGVFEPHEDYCWASYRLADYRAARLDELSESQRAALQLAARFRKGREPQFDAGLEVERAAVDDGAVDPGDHQ